MKKANLKDLKDTEVVQQLKDARKELREQRFQYAVAKSLENPRKIRNLRKKIARVINHPKREKKFKPAIVNLFYYKKGQK